MACGNPYNDGRSRRAQAAWRSTISQSQSSAVIRSERIRANGLDFHVHVCGEGDRLALCLHGFPEIGYSWRHQMQLLASLGYRVWAPDLRGYGLTDRPVGLKNYAFEILMEDVAGLIDASGSLEVTLIAHDWGGIIAWQFAALRVRELENLIILNAPAPRPQDKPPSIFSRQFWRYSYVFFFQLPWLPEWVIRRKNYRAVEHIFRGSTAVAPERFSDDVIAVYQEAAARPGALTAMINYYRALLRGGGARRLKELGFPKIETPTLILWGEGDPILPAEMIEDAGTWISDVTIRLIPNAGHWVQQEAPEVVNSALQEWLAGDVGSPTDRPTG
ncbi:MAG: alpha/beta hydrolase [Myxococcales bacterium]|nr:alpha/beta hydrolase [Myxococcales bacterium]HIK85106.1 alpha/beta hydrolase [Myxococcales bacterium]